MRAFQWPRQEGQPRRIQRMTSEGSSVCVTTARATSVSCASTHCHTEMK